MPTPASPSPSPHLDDPALLRQAVADLKTVYAQLLALVEHSLSADPEEEASQAIAFEAQIGQLLREADLRLGLLHERIDPWAERRRLFDPDLAAEVDAFLSSLAAGLGALQTQLRHRTADLDRRMADIKENLARLGRQQHGVRGYRQGDAKAKRIDSKA